METGARKNGMMQAGAQARRPAARADTVPHRAGESIPRNAYICRVSARSDLLAGRTARDGLGPSHDGSTRFSRGRVDTSRCGDKSGPASKSAIETRNHSKPQFQSGEWLRTMKFHHQERRKPRARKGQLPGWMGEFADAESSRARWRKDSSQEMRACCKKTAFAHTPQAPH